MQAGNPAADPVIRGPQQTNDIAYDCHRQQQPRKSDPAKQENHYHRIDDTHQIPQMIVAAVKQEIYQHPFLRFMQKRRVLQKNNSEINQRQRGIQNDSLQKSCYNGGRAFAVKGFLQKITACAEKERNGQSGQYLDITVRTASKPGKLPVYGLRSPELPQTDGRYQYC